MAEKALEVANNVLLGGSYMSDFFCRNKLENEVEKKGMNINNRIVLGIIQW